MSHSIFDPIRSGASSYRYLLGGEWRESSSSRTITIASPVHGEALGDVQKLTVEEVCESVENAHSAYASWNARSISERADVLKKAAALIREHTEELAQVLCLEIAKPIRGARKEVRRTADLVEYFAEEGRRYYGEIIWGDSFPGYSKSKLCLVTREPLGVVCAIGPFNYPLNLTASKIAPALITGNSVVLKSPRQGSIACTYMVRLFEAAGVPAGCLNLVTGSAREIGDSLTGHPKIGMISFTGGSSTGDHIARNVGVKPQMMELGGKDAAIVCEDCDLDFTAAQIVKGGFSFSGQRCTAVKRVLALPGIADELAAKVAAGVAELTVGDPRDEDTVIGPVIDEAKADYLQELVDDALEKGATLLCGNRREGNTFWPTLLDRVTTDMRVAWEEPFGPIVPILRVADVDEAIEIANRSEYGLQSSVFTQDIDRGFKVGLALEVGTVNINGAPSRGPDHFPFLGVKNSGMMTQGVHYSISAMTRDRGITLNLRG